MRTEQSKQNNPALKAGDIFSERCFMSEGGGDMTKYIRNLVKYQNTLLYRFESLYRDITEVAPFGKYKAIKHLHQ